MTHSTSSLSCSCCEAKHEHRALLLSLKQVAAPYWNVLLCNLCIETCNDILEEEGIATDAVPFARPARAHTASYTPRRTYRCSFCGREEAQVMRLICLHPENDLRICNLCVGACNTRIAELNKERKRGTMDDLTGDTVDQPP